MTKRFETWYKKYVEQCDVKYLNQLELLHDSLRNAEEKTQRIVNSRMKSGLMQQSNLDDIIRSSHEEIYKLKSQIVNMSRIREEMDNTVLKQTAKKVYDKLVKHPKIKKIEISKEKNLNVYVKTLKVKNNEIGNFKITYRLPNTFFIRNLEYVVDGNLDHWHVRFGEPCLASWKPILWKQMDTYQIFLFIDTLIHYLLLSNDTHAYMSYDEWIKKFKKKEKIKKTEINTSETTSEQISYIQIYDNQAYTNIVDNDISIIGTGAGWSTSALSTGTFLNTYASC